MLKEQKVFRDPIHGYVHINNQLFWDLINCSEFQRLKRIHQLGATFQVYHTAEHTRFSHSLGVYEIIRRIVTEVDDVNKKLSEYEKITLMAAGLLHDIGHGPFSHLFESISEINHEKYTQKIILEDTNINKVLKNFDENLPQDIANLINHKHSNPLMIQLISSQLDADRMDYLLRDAYFTGTSYGDFDLERIIRTMRVANDKIVYKQSGIHTIEDYIMSRYHMYWQVYYHPISRTYEMMLRSWFKRLEELNFKKFTLLAPILEKKLSLQDYLRLDESVIFFYLNLSCYESDPILKDLGNKILNRNLFEYQDYQNQEQIDKIKKSLNDQNYDLKYYFNQDEASQKPYLPYEAANNSPIMILLENKEIKELSEVSEIVNAIALSGKNKKDQKIYYPRS